MYPVKSERDITPALLAVSRDQTFTLGMRSWARAVTAASQSAYLYHFTRTPPWPNPAFGAYHAAEIAYVFANVSRQPWAQPGDIRLSDQMSSYWVNFATRGDPNHAGLPLWQPYNLADEFHISFGEGAQAGQHLLREQLDFLELAQRRRQSPD